MVLLFLAEGFEEIEALCPLDLLRRVGVEVKTVGVTGKKVCGSHGIEVTADLACDEISAEVPEMVILPGGMPGTLNLKKDPTVQKMLEKAVKANAWIAAICAAPSILGEAGLLCGKEAICFPGFEKSLTGAKISDKKVVRDGRFITAAGMGVALEFGLELVAVLTSEEKAKTLRASLQAL